MNDEQVLNLQKALVRGHGVEVKQLKTLLQFKTTGAYREAKHRLEALNDRIEFEHANGCFEGKEDNELQKLVEDQASDLRWIGMMIESPRD